VKAKGTEKVTLRSAVDNSVIVDGTSTLFPDERRRIALTKLDFVYANAEDVELAVESAAKALLEWQALGPVRNISGPQANRDAHSFLVETWGAALELRDFD
jgi:hypothetical protein